MKLPSFFRQQKKAETMTFEVVGMHCASCAAMIENELEDAGYKARCSYAKQTLQIEKKIPIDAKRIREVLQHVGYDIKV
jgi:copper chaperone CopZ